MSFADREQREREFREAADEEPREHWSKGARPSGYQEEPPTDDDPEVVTWEVFAADNEPGADPIVGHSSDDALLVEGGDAMVYGDGGATKTTLLVDLACHLAAGDPCLGIPIPQRRQTLWIENEGPRPLFARSSPGSSTSGAAVH
jgi:hypothetical protein